MLLSEAGRKGGKLASRERKPYSEWNLVKETNRKGANNPCAKEYIITHPDGTTEQVKALKTWCESKGLNYNSFHNQCVGRKKSHKGYSILT